MTTISKYHRTALFVDGQALRSNGQYRERVQRLNQSLNGPNIKVDIFTVFPEAQVSGVVAGLQTTPPAPTHHTGTSLNVQALEALGREKGYVQTLVALPTRD